MIYVANETPADTDTPEPDLYDLRVRLIQCHQRMQDEGLRALVLFEGPNAAGKTSTILDMMHYLNNRAAQMVALPIPSNVEQTQWYLQRYIHHFPRAGWMDLYDRSYYNQVTVCPFHGFCSQQQYEAALEDIPPFERILVRDGVILVKLLLQISQATQRQRFDERYADPLKSFKMKPLDEEEQRRWGDFQAYITRMLEVTDTAEAPWTCIDANDREAGLIQSYTAVVEAIENTPTPTPPAPAQVP